MVGYSARALPPLHCALVVLSVPNGIAVPLLSDPNAGHMDPCDRIPFVRAQPSSDGKKWSSIVSPMQKNETLRHMATNSFIGSNISDQMPSLVRINAENRTNSTKMTTLTTRTFHSYS